MSDGQYLAAIEQALVTFDRDHDLERFHRAVEAALRAWRGQ